MARYGKLTFERVGTLRSLLGKELHWKLVKKAGGDPDRDLWAIVRHKGARFLVVAFDEDADSNFDLGCDEHEDGAVHDCKVCDKVACTTATFRVRSIPFKTIDDTNAIRLAAHLVAGYDMTAAPDGGTDDDCPVYCADTMKGDKGEKLTKDHNLIERAKHTVECHRDNGYLGAFLIGFCT